MSYLTSTPINIGYDKVHNDLYPYLNDCYCTPIFKVGDLVKIRTDWSSFFASLRAGNINDFNHNVYLYKDEMFIVTELVPFRRFKRNFVYYHAEHIRSDVFVKERSFLYNLCKPDDLSCSLNSVDLICIEKYK